jgi:16S rRNA (adenine1518-N6/adenine1519-N6)-dimethyltransferase
LTRPLVQRLDHLQVVEIDRDIIARLRQEYSPGKLTVHAGDALVFDFGHLAGDSGAGLRIVGNLPYNISTPLLFHLASFGTCVRDMHFMLQKGSRRAHGRCPRQWRLRPSVGDAAIPVRDGASARCAARGFRSPAQGHSAVVRLIPRAAADLSARDERHFATLGVDSLQRSAARCCATVSGDCSKTLSWRRSALRQAVGPRNCRSMTTFCWLIV